MHPPRSHSPHVDAHSNVLAGRAGQQSLGGHTNTAARPVPQYSPLGQHQNRRFQEQGSLRPPQMSSQTQRLPFVQNGMLHGPSTQQSVSMHGRSVQSSPIGHPQASIHSPHFIFQPSNTHHPLQQSQLHQQRPEQRPSYMHPSTDFQPPGPLSLAEQPNGWHPQQQHDARVNTDSGRSSQFSMQHGGPI